MKYISLLIVLIIISVQKCEESGVINFTDLENNIKLEISMNPSPFLKRYVIDGKGISVMLKNKNTQIDSILNYYPITDVNYQEFEEKLLEFNKDSYQNNCIEDGQIFNLRLQQNDIESKNIMFVNIYNEKLDSIINYININVDIDHKIFYDKIALNSLSVNCQ